MAVDGLIWGLGCFGFFVFFIADFVMAYALNQLKRQHPAIDDCAPDGDAGVDGIPSGRSVVDDETLANGAARSATLAAAATLASAVSGSMPAGSQQDRFHRFVIFCSMAAPFLWLFQLMAPESMQWSSFPVPAWLGYLTVVPAFVLSLIYVLRAARIAQTQEITKSQWLAAMWFRLDVICVVAVALLFGWGDWLVAACLFIVDVYLAQRLLLTEKRLATIVQGTQLLPDDDLELARRQEVGGGTGLAAAVAGGRSSLA